MVSGHLARDAGSLDPRPSLPQTVWVAYADLYGLIQPRPSVRHYRTLSELRMIAFLISASLGGTGRANQVN